MIETNDMIAKKISQNKYSMKILFLSKNDKCNIFMDNMNAEKRQYFGLF